jgi:serine/threonine protein kinase
MSPERILGEHVDIRSDLYALGAILYELLTGEAIFRGDDIEQIERNHLAPSRSLIHPTLARYPGIEPVLRSLLARWPSERYADPVILQQALRTLASYPPSVSVRPQIDTEPQIPSLRRRLSACWRAADLHRLQFDRWWSISGAFIVWSWTTEGRKNAAIAGTNHIVHHPLQFNLYFEKRHVRIASWAHQNHHQGFFECQFAPLISY